MSFPLMRDLNFVVNISYILPQRLKIVRNKLTLFLPCMFIVENKSKSVISNEKDKIDEIDINDIKGQNRQNRPYRQYRQNRRDRQDR